ncbi:hypothetical protein B5V91_18730, partial [Heyndrickxia sporothermodurans]
VKRGWGFSMKKRTLYLIAFLGMFLLIPFTANAAENNDDVQEEVLVSKLTQNEIDYLRNNVGLTESEIEDFPIEVLLQLIDNKAKKEASGFNIEDHYELSSSPGAIATFGTIKKSTLKLGATAFKVSSDKSGAYKYYFYGNFEWLKPPVWGLVDKMTIGFPSANRFYLPTSKGKVTQHAHKYNYSYNRGTTWVGKAIKTTPTNFENNSGVAGSFDLVPGEILHKGYIGQYV